MPNSQANDEFQEGYADGNNGDAPKSDGVFYMQGYRDGVADRKNEGYIQKVTEATIIQTYDTQKGEWVKQVAIVADECKFLDKDGISADMPEDEQGVQPYLPFEMVQPVEKKHSVRVKFGIELEELF